MTTPNDQVVAALDDIEIPVFNSPRGADGFAQMMNQAKGNDEVDESYVKATLSNARGIYDKADEAQTAAIKAAEAAKKAAERAGKTESDVAELKKRQEESDAASAKAAQAERFRQLSDAFSQRMKDYTLSDVLTHNGYEGLQSEQVDGIDVPLTYAEALQAAVSRGKPEEVAIVFEKMAKKLYNLTGRGQVSPRGGAANASASQQQPNGYVQEIASVNRRYARADSFDSIKAKQQAIAEVRAKYGMGAAQ